MEELSGILMLPSLAVLGWQAYSWLRTGHWTALPIAKAFEYLEWPIPATTWGGLQKIIDWIFDIPLSLTLFVLAFIVLVIGAILQDLYENYQANRARLRQR